MGTSTNTDTGAYEHVLRNVDAETAELLSSGDPTQYESAEALHAAILGED